MFSFCDTLSKLFYVTISQKPSMLHVFREKDAGVAEGNAQRRNVQPGSDL